METELSRLFKMKSIEPGKVRRLVVRKLDTCQIVKKRAEANGKNKEVLAVYFLDCEIEIRDAQGHPYNLPGYRFCLVEDTNYPAARMWVTEPLVNGRVELPTIKGKPAQDYLWNEFGLMAPDDFEIRLKSLPIDADGAYLFGPIESYWTPERSIKKCEHAL